MMRELSTEELGTLADDAKATLALSGNCAQTSFSVLQRMFDLDGDQVLRALTAFPGVALRGETCGGVTGCLMAIGLVFGRDRLDDGQGFTAALVPSRRFCRRFIDRNGSTACAEILNAKLGRKFNLADLGESADYVRAGGPNACGELIADAVQTAAQILATRPTKV